MPDHRQNRDKKKKSARKLAVLVFAVSAVACVSASAQQYPSKTIRFVVPYPPGGGTDLVTRTLARRMSETWGHQVIVDNRPGAQGNIGTAWVSKTPPDGYTLLMQSPPLTINPFLYSNVGFDPIKSFAPITIATQQPYFVVTHPSVPARSIKELLALAKANPQRLTFGTSGSIAQLAGELLQLMTKTHLTHVPYKGAGPALLDLIAGQLDVTITTPSGPLPFVQAGRVRLLAVTSRTRLNIVPDTPTVAESGVPGYEVIGWYGVLVPVGTPRDIVMKLNAEMVRILRLPETRELLARDAVQPVGTTPEEFAEFISSETAKWGKVVKAAGIKPE